MATPPTEWDALKHFKWIRLYDGILAASTLGCWALLAWLRWHGTETRQTQIFLALMSLVILGPLRELLGLIDAIDGEVAAGLRFHGHFEQ